VLAANGHYNERVNRVLDYIGEHLDQELSLDRLSQIACFSPFHFHRVFQGVTGETLNSHVRRVRLERAALLMKASPRKRITDVAIDAGFAGTAEFSRAFKSHFGRTPSSWDRRSPLEKSKICKAPEGLSFYTLEELENWKTSADVRVQVSRFEPFRYVYIRVFAPYGNMKLVDAYYSLTRWLADRGTDMRDIVFIGMSLDDPSITPSEQCRYDMGVAFRKKPASDGPLSEILHSRGRADLGVALPDRSECDLCEFSIRDLEAQETVAIHCVGDLGHVERAWHYLYRIWLPSGAYEPANFPAMEVFVRQPEEIGWETFDLHTCIPVERL